MTKPLVVLAAAVCISGAAQAQKGAPPMSEGALKARLYSYAADSMRGRLTGTPDNDRATAYVAAEFKKAGLKPAGDGGSFFQKVPLNKRVHDASVTLSVNGIVLAPYKDFLPRELGYPIAPFAGIPTIYAGVSGTVMDTTVLLPAAQGAGKVVVISPKAGDPQVTRAPLMQRYASAAAIVIGNFDDMSPELRAQLGEGAVTLADAAPNTTPARGAYFHINRATVIALFGKPLAELTVGTEGKAFSGGIAFKDSPSSARNVVGIVEGSDPKLKGEYVAIGAHNDHVGVGEPVDPDSLRAFNLELRRKQLANNGIVTPEIVASIKVNMDSVRKAHPKARVDSIFNGADDDGSGTVGLLELARAFGASKVTPKRSILFVSHTGEELGLFGSEYFTDHPTVPRDSIVGQVNIDMIGRGGPGEEPGGGPDYVQSIGSGRLSTELKALSEQVSVAKGFNWKIDYQYDANGHPEQYYCRSDHYNYARYGIPIIFLSTGGHADYHQVTDGPEFIDYAKLSKVTRYVYELGSAIGNLDHRLVVDHPKPDPKGRCVQ
jgi:hypothetical protein